MTDRGDETQTRPRVVHVIATLVTGGAERQVELLATHTDADVSVLALFAGGPVADSMRAAGIPVTVLGLTGWRRATAWWAVARHLRVQRASLVHVHLLSGQLWGIPAARLARIPVISTEHSLMDHSIEGRPLTWWLRRLYLTLERLTVGTIAVSERTAERLIAWGVRPARIHVIENGIDLAAQQSSPTSRHDLRSEFGIPPEAQVFIGVGRLDPVKRFDALLAGLQDALQDGAHVLIVGEGPSRLELSALAERLGVTPRVHFTGSRSDVARLLGAADCFISLSRDETFGIAIVEAAAAGLIVIYVACPALDVLDSLPAGVCKLRSSQDEPDGDVVTLSELIRNKPATSAVKTPRMEALERYDIRHTSAQLATLYARVYRVVDGYGASSSK